MRAGVVAGLERIALVALGCGFALLLVEGGLRAAGLLWLWHRERANVVAIDAADTIRVLCLGESTTALGGADSYPRLLETVLNRDGGGRRFRVTNVGIPGITTDTVMQYLDAELDWCRPHVVVAMLGINDALVEDDAGQRPSEFSSWRIVKVAQLAIGNLRAKLARPTAPADDPLAAPALAAIARRDLEGAEAILLGDASRQAHDVHAEPLRNTAHAVVTGLTVSSRFDDAERFARAWLDAHPDDTTMREMIWGNRITEAARDAQERRLDVAEAKLATLDGTVPEGARVSRAAMLGIRATIAELRGAPDDANRYRVAAEALRIGRWRASTERNYRHLVEVLRERRIRLIAMQYPLREVASLRALLDDPPDVVFVDNDGTFRNALRAASWDTWFVDAFAGDFGHTTPAGARLIAGNAARAILATVPPGEVHVARPRRHRADAPALSGQPLH